jgi:hypothetical protein
MVFQMCPQFEKPIGADAKPLAAAPGNEVIIRLKLRWQTASAK